MGERKGRGRERAGGGEGRERKKREQGGGRGREGGRKGRRRGNGERKGGGIIETLLTISVRSSASKRYNAFSHNHTLSTQEACSSSSVIKTAME